MLILATKVCVSEATARGTHSKVSEASPKRQPVTLFVWVVVTAVELLIIFRVPELLAACFAHCLVSAHVVALKGCECRVDTHCGLSI